MTDTKKVGDISMFVLTRYSRIKLSRFVILTLFCIVISIVSSCNSVRSNSGLEERIASLYQAEASRDWECWYQMVWARSHYKIPFEQFEKMSKVRDFSIVSWKVKSVSPSALPSDELVNVNEAVAVAMDVVVKYADGRRETSPYQTDYWVKDGGKWYFYWRGWPTD